MIKAIIFDFDGLIIDTETPWYESYKEVYRQYGVDLPLELWGACIGTTFDAFNPFEYLQKASGQVVDKQKIMMETKTIYHQLMQDQQPRPGVKQYLLEAKEHGLSVGLASSSTKNWIEPYLVHHKLIDYFDVLVTSDDVKKVKPDPELYVKAMTSLNVNGRETIAFEDSLNGLNAAKAAGAFCVIVPNQVTSYMKFEKYDLRLTSMDQIGLTSVLSQVNSWKDFQHWT